ncbi:MAG: dihydropyrimidine dehydrogenase, partial [Kiritimatiellaeota bacterium]|nr:dihydropyrimidine dehydrogenase [Kiritimatiellota bacterium]
MHNEATMTLKDRMAIPQQEMPTQDPRERIGNTREVATGYTAEMAMKEAQRCLQCPAKPCVKGCPVAIDIPGFIKAMAEGKDDEAIAVIKRTSLLPAVCGRVCPQETQCMAHCTVGKMLKDPMKSVCIGRLERYAADRERTGGRASSLAEVKP